MEEHKIAWWETIDYGLSEKEQRQVQKLSQEVVERMKILNLLKAAKKLGDIIKYKPNI